ncbi:hypothetical protein JIN77_09595 [Verrucomicrobiaceae bacterium R5-34]|nr:hypothetical protein [Verrucomicrobiaceae bacterium R5-34]
MTLSLAANVVAGEDTPFFQGQFRNARLLARALNIMARVVGERWFDPAEVARSRQMDPVVTSGCGHLRFEGFSACRSVYGRIDVLPEGVNVVQEKRGTTNIDFNQEMCRALGRVRRGQDLSVCVSRDDFLLTRDEETVIEKKVKLPLSWIKGFASVQAIVSEFGKVLSLDGVAARDLFAQLPQVGDGRDTHWLSPDPNRPRISRIQTQGAIQLSGGRRLLALQELVPFAASLTIHANNDGTMSSWTLSFEGFRIGILISPEVWRGFSGEGAALGELVKVDDRVDEVRAHLADAGLIDPEVLAIHCGIDLPTLRRVLARLASQGLVGFDQMTGSCYERVLPGSELLVEKVNPRLVSARRWLEDGRVIVDRQKEDEIHAHVDLGEGRNYLVAIAGKRFRCSCFWCGQFGESRGPCAHVLAVHLLIDAR